MQIEERNVNGTVVVRLLETRLGADKAPNFKRTMGRYLQAGNKQLVLDLCRVEFIDSSGLGAILSVLKQMGDDGKLAICSATEPVASMFKLTRMDRVFAFYKTVEEALAAK